jgi:hypothetical protein
MIAHPERQGQQKDSEYQRISTDPQNDRKRTWCKQDQHAEQQREHTDDDQEPFVCDRPSQMNARDDFKHAREPGGL